jgi:hypothetical protein
MEIFDVEAVIKGAVPNISLKVISEQHQNIPQLCAVSVLRLLVCTDYDPKKKFQND